MRFSKSFPATPTPRPFLNYSKLPLPTEYEKHLRVAANLMTMLGFNFILGSNFIFLCFKLIIIYYKTQKQKKINFEPRITLNHNNYEPRAQIKQMFQEGELKQEIKRQSRSFLQNTLFQKRLLQILMSI